MLLLQQAWAAGWERGGGEARRRHPARSASVHAIAGPAAGPPQLTAANCGTPSTELGALLMVKGAQLKEEAAPERER